MLKINEFERRTLDLLDWSAKKSMHKLRIGELAGQVLSSTPISPGIWFEWDDEHSNIKAEYRGGKGQLLEVDFDVQRPGRWLTLNISLNSEPVAEDKAIMMVCRLSASSSFTVTPVVRIGEADRFQDIRMGDALHVTSSPLVHTAILRPSAGSPLCQPHRWKKLMFDIPQVTGTLVIGDLCCFCAETPANEAS